MTRAVPSVNAMRLLCVAAGLTVLSTHGARAQAATASHAPLKHPVVCAQGVRVYSEAAQAPSPRDTVTMPPADGPVRVTSPEEAEAAELAMRGRAGSVGATGVLITDVTDDDGAGQRRIHRSVTAFFASADSAHAQLACKQRR